MYCLFNPVYHLFSFREAYAETSQADLRGEAIESAKAPGPQKTNLERALQMQGG